MIISEYLLSNIKCSNEERKDCFSSIFLIMDFAKIATKRGLLSLEPMLDKLEDRFLAKGLQMIADGVDPEIVSDVLQTTVLADGLKGKELLDKLIIITGVLSIQSGDTPFFVEQKLISLLGVEIFTEWEKIKDEGNIDISIDLE